MRQRLTTLASVGRSLLAVGAGAAGGILAWNLLIVGDDGAWMTYGLFALGVVAAAALGMSKQPMVGAVLAATLTVLPIVTEFDFPILTILPAIIVAFGCMMCWYSGQPERPLLPGRF